MNMRISKITGKGADVVIDCVGAENTIRDTFRILNKGGALVVGGIWLWGIQGVCKRKYEDRNSFI
jgi:threonine dehydrogenase-like Zn-dependent dehydrogenase